jgi:hypothetical protein
VAGRVQRPIYEVQGPVHYERDNWRIDWLEIFLAEPMAVARRLARSQAIWKSTGPATNGRIKAVTRKIFAGRVGFSPPQTHTDRDWR